MPGTNTETRTLASSLTCVQPGCRGHFNPASAGVGDLTGWWWAAGEDDRSQIHDHRVNVADDSIFRALLAVEEVSLVAADHQGIMVVLYREDEMGLIRIGLHGEIWAV